jgi:hypothetical protein
LSKCFSEYNHQNSNIKNPKNVNSVEFSDNKVLNEQILDFFKNEYNKNIDNHRQDNYYTAKGKIRNELLKYKNTTSKILRRKREFWIFIDN